MTNQEYLIAALNNEIDDGGASWEAAIFYSISCPYFDRDSRALCHANFDKAGDRKTCVACKANWLESEVDL